MKTATGLALVAIGAILAFAVKGHPSFLNIQIVGWVIILTGIAGMAIPRRGYGWMRRRLNVPAASALSGCFFAAAHVGWGTSSEEILFLPLALLGILLALLYEYSRSLLPGAIVHGIFNLVETLQIL